MPPDLIFWLSLVLKMAVTARSATIAAAITRPAVTAILSASASQNSRSGDIAPDITRARA